MAGEKVAGIAFLLPFALGFLIRGGDVGGERDVERLEEILESDEVEIDEGREG